ncbi:hypothetical protein DRO58_01575 [Candidatus Bathyarchaeota archaeon]|nr:MAG: hypothetical protein DRO58_01575 [Candidatus Bathyarchaeota archaeon]
MIEELVLEGFQGFKHARIRFTQGLNLITGRNSTGKTSILEGIVYGLYGKLPDAADSLLVSRLVPRALMTVRLRFRGVDGRLYETVFAGRLTSDGRFRSEKTGMIVDGKPLDVSRQEELRRRVSKGIGLGYRRFLNTVYVRQGRLTDILNPKREDMDAVLGINLLRELTQQLENAEKTLSKWEGRDVKTLIEQLEEREIPDKEKALKLLEEKVGNLKREVEELQERIRKAESPELEKLLGLIGKRDELLKSINDERVAVNTLLAGAGAESPKQLREDVKRLEAEVRDRSNLLGDLKNKRDRLSARRTQLQTKAKQLVEEVKTHRELLEKGVATCPTCGQRIDRRLVEELANRKLRQAEELEKEAKPLDEELKRLDGQIEEVEKSITDLNSKLKNVKNTVRDVEKRMEKLGKLYEDIEALKPEIQRLLEELQLELDPMDPNLYVKVESTLAMKPEDLRKARRDLKSKLKRLRDSEKELEKTAKELEKCREDLENLRVREKASSLADMLVSRLREAVEEVRSLKLRDIAIRARRIFDSLTDQRVYTAFHIDPDSYRVYVHQKGLYEKIPATRVGGGHQTLIALALRLAILEAVRGSKILILDEPTYGVDSENLPQLIESLARTVENVGQVILVTHHGLGEEYASNIIRVSIGDDGASTVSQE